MRRLHFAYLDYANFAAQIGAFRVQCRNALHVRERPSPLDAYLRGEPAFTTVGSDDLEKRRSDEGPFDGAVVTLADHMIDKLPRLLRLVAAHCMDGAPVLVCVDAIEGVFQAGRYALYGDAIELMGSDLPPSIAIEDYALITANERFTPAHLLSLARQFIGTRKFSARLAAAIIAPPAYLHLVLANLRRKPRGLAAAGTCTSATIWMRGPWRSTTKALAERAQRFDRVFYNRINPDVVQAGSDAEEHFNTYGWRERRDPSSYFSVSGYLDANPDVAHAQMNPLWHFRDYGLAEGRNGWQR